MEKAFQTDKSFSMLALILRSYSCAALRKKLAMMPETNVVILQDVRRRLVRVHDNLEASMMCSITPHVEESAVSCPVCGLYFANELGLNMRIKNQEQSSAGS